MHTLVLSPSATVYGQPEAVSVTEDATLGCTNPYDRSKLVMEQLIGDCCQATPKLGAVLLRYFNPVGAHPSGHIGEDPGGAPNNLMPYVAQVAVGRRDKLQVFGGDYPTPDGTGVRDYLLVMDLADTHMRALEYGMRNCGAQAINVGTGREVKLVRAFEQASGRVVPYKIVARPAGDVAELWASSQRAERLLDWKVRHDLAQMCEDTWRWQMQNPADFGIEQHIGYRKT